MVRRLATTVLTLILPQGQSAPVVRKTITAVFKQHMYDRSFRQSLWDRFLYNLMDVLSRLFGAVGKSAATRPIVIGILLILALLAVARIILIFTAGDVFARRSGALGGFRRRVDQWTEAQRLAADARYTDAAHALYAALLEGVAQREDLRIHPSKTVGDYTRELRRRSSSLMPTFRDFARLYEVVVYGLGFCDRDRYERLHALATGMLGRGT
jgi:hypothetical protein